MIELRKLRSTIEALRTQLDDVFALDTKSPGSPAEPPSVGHCAVVAIVVKPIVSKMFGTAVEYVAAKVGNPPVSHWFLRFPESNLDVDLTGDQFGLPSVQVEPAGSLYENTVVRDASALNAETLARAELLLGRLEARRMYGEGRSGRGDEGDFKGISRRVDH